MAKATVWTPAKLRRLSKEYPYCADPRDLAESLGVTYVALKSKVTVLKLKRKVPSANTGRSTSTPEIDKKIRKLYLTVPVKRLAKVIEKSDTFLRKRLERLGLKIPRKIINQRKRDSRIKKGNVPMNKGKKIRDFMSPEAIEKIMATTFKKGQIPPNKAHYKDGDITIHHRKNRPGSKPHKYIRIKLRVWKELQIYNWEQVNGKIPKGYVLACKSEDTLNCDPSNWELMSKHDNMLRNSASMNLTDGFIAQSLARKKGVRGKLDKRLAKKLLKHPELLDLKRKSIQLNRAINESGKAN